MTGHPNITVGTVVVIDPTGRDLTSCLQVGKVESFDSDDGYTVALNSGEKVGGVRNIRATVPTGLPLWEALVL